jgi:hypothetical protein
MTDLKRTFTEYSVRTVKQRRDSDLILHRSQLVRDGIDSKKAKEEFNDQTPYFVYVTKPQANEMRTLLERTGISSVQQLLKTLPANQQAMTPKIMTASAIFEPKDGMNLVDFDTWRVCVGKAVENLSVSKAGIHTRSLHRFYQETSTGPSSFNFMKDFVIP